MWTYKISSGLMSSGSHQHTGYAGFPPFVNDITATHLANRGPLPVGKYTISGPEDILGGFALRLHEDKSNKMFGRSCFLIHGDSISKPGFASHGCIILPRDFRKIIWSSGDRILEVIP